MPDRVWQGAPAIEKFLLPVDDLIRHPRNPRRGQVQEIMASLTRFGQVRPILTDGRQIIAGNHTYLAARELGWTHIAAVKNEFRSDQDARAYLLADNRLPELGSYDDPQLISILGELEATGRWEGTGFNADDLDDLRAMHQIQTTAAEEFQGDYAMTAQALADRAQHLAGGRAMNEVVLFLTAGQSTDFDTHLKILKKEYGGPGGVTDTVFRAVAEAAARAA